MFLVLLLLNWPGRIAIRWDVLAAKDSLNPTYPRFQEHRECLHGWPWTYLRRDPFVSSGSPPTIRLSYWLVGSSVTWFSIVRLFLDLLFAGCVLWISVHLFERWRQRHVTLLQMHVIDVLSVAGFVAVCFSILAYHDSIHAKEERVLEKITVLTSKSVNWGNRAFDRARWQPSRIAWVKELRTHPYTSVFDRIVGFNVAGEELPLLAELKHLQYVKVRGEVTNQQLDVLTSLPRLIVLDLSVYHVSDDSSPVDILRLPPLPNLRGLNFGGSAEFRGDGLESLDRIEVLDLSGTSLNDEGLAKLGRMSQLKHLYLDATEISNEGLASLRGLHNLERLSVRFVNVNEQGLRHIAQLKNLHWLYLYRSDRLNEAEQAIVASMARLQNPDLGLADEAELRDLQNAFPDEGLRRW